MDHFATNFITNPVFIFIIAFLAAWVKWSNGNLPGMITRILISVVYLWLALMPQMSVDLFKFLARWAIALLLLEEVVYYIAYKIKHRGLSWN